MPSLSAVFRHRVCILLDQPQCWRPQLFEYDPFSESVIARPQAAYAKLRDEAPVYYLEKYDAWALSRFEDIWACSSDTRFSTASGTTPAQVLTRDQPVTPMLNVLDPPRHARLRAAIRKCFLPRYLRAIEPLARGLFDGLIDGVIEKGECDVVRDLGSKFSVTIACKAIGLPVADGPYLNQLVTRFFRHDPGQQGMTSDGLAALTEMTAYCADRVAALRKAPLDGPQAANALIEFEDEQGVLSDEEIASHLTMLVIGGSETFPKTLANGIVRLWEHPDQRAALAVDPRGIPAAYNEILRYDMPTQFLCRTLLGDVELRGKSLRAGQGALFLYASANHDEAEFDEPEVFDIRRSPRRILSFGAGTHACLGTHVARLEARVAFEMILDRMPGYEVDLGSAVRFRTEFVQGYASLPIRFDPQASDDR
jgi:cytochrome P450